MNSLIISLGLWLADKAAGKGFDLLIEKLNKENIDQKFIESINVVSEKIQKKYPGLLGNSIENFFSHKLVADELFKQLFIDSKINVEVLLKELDTETIPEEFINDFLQELKSEVQKDKDLNSIFSNKEMLLSILDINKGIDEIIRNTSLSKNEITEIKKLLKERFKENFTLDSFKRNYYPNVLNNLSQMNFLGLRISASIKKGRKKLQDIFVEPLFQPIKNEGVGELKKYFQEKLIGKNRKANVFTLADLFSLNQNLVILGNPGGGKSLLVKAMICEIISKEKQIFRNTEIYNSIPFRIELRKYLIYKKEKQTGIIKYLASVLESEFGIIAINFQILDELIKNNAVVIFFDGLDEIFNVNDKIDIKNDIENIHNNYPLLTSITTSRFIGYDDAKLEEKIFMELKILEFNDDQIQEYVNKWYCCEENNDETRTKEINDFLAKRHKIDDELISNPLFLSLIVILYRNNLRIPESKLEIYQSCTKTLVDKWDTQKELKIDLDNEIFKRRESIFADIAYWQYKKLSSSNTTINYDLVREVVKESLVKKLKLSDEHKAENDAEMFLLYAQKRSLYFDNNFTHKTFLEYYTSFWIFTNIEKKHKGDERNRIIKKYINNSYWTIVLELLFNHIDKDQPDNEIIDSIIIDLLNKGENSYPFLLTVLPSLSNVSASIVKRVFREMILSMVNQDKRITKRRKQIFRSISDRVLDCISYESFSILFEQVIAEVYSGLKVVKSKIDLYRLLLELKFWDFKNRGKIFEHILSKIEIDELALNEINIWRLSQTQKEAFIYPQSVIYAIKKFGLSSIYNNLEFKFNEIAFVSIFESMYSHIFYLDLIDFESTLQSLDEAGYTKEIFLRDIEKAWPIRQYARENIKTDAFIKKLNNSEDPIIIKIFIYVLSELLSYNKNIDSSSTINGIQNSQIQELLKNVMAERGIEKKKKIIQLANF